MSDVKQNAKGKANILIGEQTVNNGLSPEQACSLALRLFQESFPKLQERAAEIAEKRAIEVVEKFVQKMTSKGITDFSALGDPGMQVSLFEAQKNYAKYGTKELLDILAGLMVSRMEEDDLVMRVTIDEAIQIIPKLTTSQLNYLSCIFVTKCINMPTIKTINDLINYLGFYARVLPNRGIKEMDYINGLGLLTIGLGKPSKVLSKLYNLDEKEIEKILPVEFRDVPGDYILSYTGILLSIINLENIASVKFNKKTWIC